MPRISVIIPLFNGAGTVGEAVRSLLGSTEQDWHAVIVDDGSTDGGASVRAAYAAVGSDERFTVLSQANVGLAGARNAGLDYLASGASRIWRGSHVAFLDADDAFSPTGLATLLDTATKHGTAAYGAFQLRRHDPSVTLAESPFIATQAPAHGVLDLGGWLDGVFVVVHSTLLPWEAIADMRFDRQRTRVEDYDLWLRLAARGLRWTAAEPHSPPVCLYRIAPGSMSQDYRAMLAHARCVQSDAHRRARAALIDGRLRQSGLAHIDCSFIAEARRLGSLALMWSTRQALCGSDQAESFEAAGELLIGTAGDVDVTAASLAGAVVGAMVSGNGLPAASCSEPAIQQRIAGWAAHIERLGRGQPGLAEATLADCVLRTVPYADVDDAVVRVVEGMVGGRPPRVVIFGHGPNARRISARYEAAGVALEARVATGDAGAAGNQPLKPGDVAVMADVDERPYMHAWKASVLDAGRVHVSWPTVRQRIAAERTAAPLPTDQVSALPLALAVVLVGGDAVGGVMTWAATAGAAVARVQAAVAAGSRLNFESLFCSLDQAGADSVERLLAECTTEQQARCTHTKLGGRSFAGVGAPQGYQVIRAVCAAIAQRHPAIVIPDSTDLTWIAAHLCAARPGGPKLVAGAYTNDAYNRGLLEHFAPWEGAFGCSPACTAWLQQIASRQVTDVGCDFPIAVVPAGAAVADAPRRVATDPAKPLRCVYVGRLDEPQKRIGDLLQLCTLLHERNQTRALGQPRVLVDIIGTGPLDLINSVKHVAGQCPGTLTYRGPMNRADVGAAWDDYDVLALCSAAEGLSVSMQEAMGRGVVPVVSSLPGVERWVIAGKSGVLAPVGRPDIFAERLIELANDRDRLAMLGRGAWQVAGSLGGFDRTARDLLELLQRVIDRPAVQTSARARSPQPIARWPAWQSGQHVSNLPAACPHRCAAEHAAASLAVSVPRTEPDTNDSTSDPLAGWSSPVPGLHLGDALLRAARDGLHPLVVFPFGDHTRRAIAELSAVGEASLLSTIGCFADDRAAADESAAGDAFVKNATLCSPGLAPVLSPVEAASLIGVKVATGDRAVVLVSSDTSEGILMRSDAVTRFRTAGARVIGVYLLETNERS